MTKMFTVDGKVVRTYNPIIGCLHGCSYCYAREMAEGRLMGTPKYAEGFKPQLWEPALKSRFHSGLVFVSDMGDMWGDWVSDVWIWRVLEVVRASPGATFLMLTKNPARYHEFLDIMPQNVVLGATIETDKHHEGISQAPIPWERALALSKVMGFHKMLSIEPIMDFDLGGLVEMVRMVKPEFVYVGYDNHNHHLLEPSLAKTQELIARLRGFTEVREKTIRRAWWET